MQSVEQIFLLAVAAVYAILPVFGSKCLPPRVEIVVVSCDFIVKQQMLLKFSDLGLISMTKHNRVKFIRILEQILGQNPFYCKYKND